MKAEEFLKLATKGTEAIKRLIDKGLIFRHEMDCWFWGSRYDAKGSIYGYSVRESGCVRFLEMNKVTA
jgi:sarcosine oxidase delta subunit